jgi:hypothetical protein
MPGHGLRAAVFPQLRAHRQARLAGLFPPGAESPAARPGRQRAVGSPLATVPPTSDQRCSKWHTSRALSARRLQVLRNGRVTETLEAVKLSHEATHGTTSVTPKRCLDLRL